MTTREPFDLVVIGSGVAGWTAARRAQQLGLNVAVTEKFESGPGFGNGRMSGGVYHTCYLDPRIRTPQEIAQTLEWATDGHARPDVLRTFSENARRGIQFLESEGAVYGRSGDLEWHENWLPPIVMMESSLPPSPQPLDLVKHWQDSGPDRLLSGMWRSYLAAGGEYQAANPALELITEDKRIVGVRTLAGDVRGRSVLIADGGFHSNKALGKKYYGSDGYAIRASRQNMGDGLQMALAVGGSTYHIDKFYGHLMHRGVVEDHRLWSSSADEVAEGGLVVDSRGRGLRPERPTFMHINHAMIRSESPLDCWVVVDAAGWDSLGGARHVEKAAATGARLERANTVGELARRLGMDAERLQSSIDEHNRRLNEPLGLPESGKGVAHPPVMPRPIRRGPFHAMPIVVGVPLNLGGILVNGKGEVLDEAGGVIPGLRAAGNCMGGLQGGPNYGYSGGWSQATVFGLVAAEETAASLRMEGVAAR